MMKVLLEGVRTEILEAYKLPYWKIFSMNKLINRRFFLSAFNLHKMHREEAIFILAESYPIDVSFWFPNRKL